MIKEYASTYFKHGLHSETSVCLADGKTRTPDLVALYTSEARAFGLLNAQQEISLAKSIEDSTREILCIVAAYPTSLVPVFQAFRAGDNGRYKIQSLIYGLVDLTPIKTTLSKTSDNLDRSVAFNAEEIKKRLNALLLLRFIYGCRPICKAFSSQFQIIGANIYPTYNWVTNNPGHNGISAFLHTLSRRRLLNK